MVSTKALPCAMVSALRRALSGAWLDPCEMPFTAAAISRVKVAACCRCSCWARAPCACCLTAREMGSVAEVIRAATFTSLPIVSRSPFCISFKHSASSPASSGPSSNATSSPRSPAETLRAKVTISWSGRATIRPVTTARNTPTKVLSAIPIAICCRSDS